jgi:hypothetical protein
MSNKHSIFSALTLLLAVDLGAHDAGRSIGVNFGANDTGTTAGHTLAPSDLAGALPQFNWNNMNGASGGAAGLIQDVSGTAQSSGVSISWFSPNTWSSSGRGEENNGFPPGGDRILMTGYLDTTDNSAGNATVMISGLDSEFTERGYDVLVYCVGGVSGRGGAYTIGSTTSFGTAPDHAGAHVEDPGVDLSDTGTYVRFSGRHEASFTLTASADSALYPGKVNFRAPINGIQIVAAPEFDFHDWFAVAAGGGNSSGGDFELHATFGQPLVGDLAAVDFAVVAGFWSIVTALETPAAPLLNVSLLAGQVALWWPASGSAGFVLEETAAMTNPTSTWTIVNVTPEASNGTRSVRLPLTSGNHFYRLRKP